MRRRSVLGFFLIALLAACTGTVSLPPPGPAPIPVPAGFASIYSFKGKPHDGLRPQAGLLAARGALYGTAYFGGTQDAGILFRMTAAGQETVLHTFQAGHNATDGSHPHADLIESNGVLYGSTVYGGGTTNVLCGLVGCGIIFHYDLRGVTKPYLNLVTLAPGFHSFGRLLAVGDMLYGTTRDGGVYESISFFCPLDCGTVFKVKTSGQDLDLVRSFRGFPGEPKDGSLPIAGLTLLNGALYGTTFTGGPGHNGTKGNEGTLFKFVGPRAVYSIAYNFDGTPGGARPAGPLIVRGTELFGTTYEGGTNCGNRGCGTVFAFDTALRHPVERVIHRFKGGSEDGQNPEAGLLDVNGMLYGTTYRGGAHHRGTVFKIGPTGSGYTILHSFDGQDGAHPLSGLVLLDGALYGTTEWGGSNNDGTVFKVNP